MYVCAMPLGLRTNWNAPRVPNVFALCKWQYVGPKLDKQIRICFVSMLGAKTNPMVVMYN